jgi:hypothetical protein
MTSSLAESVGAEPSEISEIGQGSSSRRASSGRQSEIAIALDRRTSRSAETGAALVELQVEEVACPAGIAAGAGEARRGRSRVYASIPPRVGTQNAIAW